MLYDMASRIIVFFFDKAFTLFKKNVQLDVRLRSDY